MWNLEQFKDNIAVLDEYGNRLTYSQLIEESEKITSAINGRCLVFSLCQNEIGSIIGYVSFMDARVVPVLINSHMEEELLRNLMDTYCPSFLWVPEQQVSKFLNTRVVYQAFHYVLLKTEYKKTYDLYSGLGLLLTTSGSTGSPKFVRQSYENILDNAQSIITYLELDQTERAITTLPMNYTYGLSIINSHLLVGATLLVTEKSVMQKEFWEFFKKANATSFGGVPYTYEMLHKIHFQRMKLPSLRTMTQAGGKLTPELHEVFAKYAEESNKKFVVMYGQCEATARMGYLPANKAVQKKGSMGIAIPGGEFYLIDTEGKKIEAPYTTGELIYKGKNVTLGYAECGEDLKLGDKRNGILQTGDMAQFDEEGYYYIVGRKKRFLKVYGNRVNLDEIDRLIKGRFGIECASTGVDDHVVIFVTEKEYTGEVKDFITEKTRLNPVTFQVFVIDEIPKNDAGKILYKELGKYYKYE